MLYDFVNAAHSGASARTAHHITECVTVEWHKGMSNVCRDLTVPAVHPRNECCTLSSGAVQRLSRVGKSLWVTLPDLIGAHSGVNMLGTQGILGPSPGNRKDTASHAARLCSSASITHSQLPILR